ncbi:MAG TPA: response regulator [Bacteroidota bacterium]|nr:response regulator [Bacteroidota bacterium]
MPIRVLYVDDEQDLQDTVSMHLHLEGFDVVTAKDGNEAMLCLDKEPFDLALLDIDLPNLNGVALLQYIKTHQINAKAIVLTGADDLHALDKCARLGASDYLPKPYNFHELMNSIACVLGEVTTTDSGEDSP